MEVNNSDCREGEGLGVGACFTMSLTRQVERVKLDPEIAWVRVRKMKGKLLARKTIIIGLRIE